MSTTLNNYQLACELIGHSLDVRAVSAGPIKDAEIADSEISETIISGSRDKTVKIWKYGRDGGIELVTFQDHKNFVGAVYFLVAEQWICTGSNDTTICIYKTDSYVPILTLRGHESTVCAITAGLEKRSIVSGSWDKTARVWTIDELGNSKILVLRGHEAAVWAVATITDLQQYITGSADKCIYSWNKMGAKLRLFKGHTDCVRGLLALPDNCFVSCANDAIIRYWNSEGECVREITGHTNYIYNMTLLSDNILLSCGEDSTLRMWNLTTGEELGNPIFHPVQSVWCVAGLQNGDIVTGSSDGIVRVFSKEPKRQASEQLRNAFKSSVDQWVQQMMEVLGGVKKTDLPGPEALLTMGTKEGQTKIVRHPDGKVQCYSWQQGKWNLVGDVTGASGGTQATSGKKLYEGKEYDFVFSVDISDTMPAIKLPYNNGEDPWQVAQTFIHRHELPQAYLDQVANFIIKNIGGSSTTTATVGYQDPFTGESRYVPGSSNTNSAQTLSTGDTLTNSAKVTQTHFPVKIYLCFSNCNVIKVLEKLKDFNAKFDNSQQQVPNDELEHLSTFASDTPVLDSSMIKTFHVLLRWPDEFLFPVIDILRLAVRKEDIFIQLNSIHFLDLILPYMNTSTANQLMILRCLVNMMHHKAGRQKVEENLMQLIKQISNIKSGTANLQIALATFYLNISISQTLNTPNAEHCHIVTEGVIDLMKWATDLEASYRIIQTLGNLTTTPFQQEITALIISVDNVMERIRYLSNTPQTGEFAKINSAGTELLAAF